MDLQEYFNNVKGMAVLSTANSSGEVDSALYSRPHFLQGGRVGFVMNDRRSYKNLQSNPNASYLFVEDGAGYKGVRLYIKMVESIDDAEIVEKYRRHHGRCGDNEAVRYFVVFEVVETRKLIGDGALE